MQKTKVKKKRWEIKIIIREYYVGEITIDRVYKLKCRIYQKGEIPKNFQKSNNNSEEDRSKPM